MIFNNIRQQFQRSADFGFDFNLKVTPTYTFTNGPTPPSQFQSFRLGLAYFLDAQGQRIREQGVGISAGFSTLGNSTGLYWLDSLGANFTVPTLLPRPTDIYGIHLDMIFPNIPSVEVDTNDASRPTYFLMFAVDRQPLKPVFGVGPNIPANFVPEETNTLALALIGLLSITLFRRHMTE